VYGVTAFLTSDALRTTPATCFYSIMLTESFVHVRFRTLLAALLCATLFSEVMPARPASAAPSFQAPLAPQPRFIAKPAAPPTQVQVKQPLRVRPAVPRSVIQPRFVPGTRPPNPIRVIGPAMLKPHEIDVVLRSMQRHRTIRDVSPPSAGTPRGRTVPTAPGSRTPSGTPVSATGVRRTQSLPANSAASGTGINHWWRYQEQNIPGNGHLMVNVGTGNMLLQGDDMSVPHKGIAMAFRRTYNSQSQHDVEAHDAAGYYSEPPGMYGNGWTNTFDAHIARNADGTLFSVFDIDGARYDFTSSVPGVLTPGPGNHTTLVGDGACGFLWTKKSGTTYYFYRPTPIGSCSGMPSSDGLVAGFAGRLYQIIGRNRNTYITFSYAWDNGDSSATGKVSTITATTESAMTATLSFADVNGHRLLQTLTYPDGVTNVVYGYDVNGNLVMVKHPANNSAGAQPTEMFAYQALTDGYVMQWAGSPRMYASCQTSAGCFADGDYTSFSFAGSGVVSSTLTAIVHQANVNPTIGDGTNTGPIQGGGFSSSVYPYATEYYTTGVSTPTYRDTDGHVTNWVVDGSGRPTQTQECTASVNQGQQCVDSQHWLISNESWDTDNNLVSEIDPRGYRTDYAYDANGNTIAVAQPQTTTYAQGTFRPTSLYSYDSYNNVTAYCDPNATHALSLDWVSTPSGDNLCPITSTLARRFVWSTDPAQSGTASPNPSYEPNGQLIALIGPGTAAAPNGYRVNYTYDPSRQGGTDFGLPTTVAGATSINQADGSSRQPAQNFWYDGNGNLGCYDKGNGAWVLGYDSLGRVVSAADPDDSAAGSGICSKSSGTAGWSTASTTTYFTDGSVASKQTASQRAAGVATTFTYDLDGDETSETHHYGCPSASSCTPGVTTKWYDGADRLVEVSLPYDSHDIQGYPMMTRYIYDISAGGTVSYQSLGLKGYGNLVKTQEYLSGTVMTPITYATEASFTQLPISSGSWTDVRATSFDALDRALGSYEAAFGSNPKLTNAYDAPPPGGGSAELGLISSVTLATNELKQYTYDETGRVTDTSYSGDGGVTSPSHVRYDAAGHVVSSGTDLLGSDTYQYDSAGEKISTTKPASLGGVVIGYDYYPDGTRQDLKFSSAQFNASPLYQYSYRTDGKRQALKLNDGGTFTWSYTAAGRLRSQTDPLTGSSVQPDSGYTIGKNPVEHPYYPATVTYAPETFAYDSYGRTTGVTFPASMFSQSEGTFDLEDSTQSVTGTSVQNPSTVTYNMCAPSNVRNEKLPTYQKNGVITCGSYFENGAAFDLQPIETVGGSGYTGTIEPAPWTVDARAGMLLSWQGATLANGNHSWRQLTYDASGRNTGDLGTLIRAAVQTDSAPNGTLLTFDGTRTKTYDAENRLRSQQTTTTTYTSRFDDGGSGSTAQSLAVDYGPDSHPTRFNMSLKTSNDPYTANMIWDDGDIVAQCFYDAAAWSSCPSWSFPVEGFADYDGTSRITVLDRGIAGQISDLHDAYGFSGMALVGRPSRVMTNRSIAPAPDSGTGLSLSSLPMHKTAPDGWTFDNNTWQGVRTMDASIGTWTTPDAYAGDVHDPMSQKPFMWNRNNPYAYSDPSGYCPQGQSGCMGGVDWTYNLNFWTGALTALSFIIPGGVTGDAAKAVGATEHAAESAGATKVVGTVVKGFTRHGLNRQISRPGGAASERAILDALRHPQDVLKKVDSQGRESTTYVGSDAQVTLNADGKIVTSNALTQEGLKAPGANIPK
jgi:YD repeat-containing protein